MSWHRNWVTDTESEWVRTTTEEVEGEVNILPDQPEYAVVWGVTYAEFTPGLDPADAARFADEKVSALLDSIAAKTKPRPS